MAVLDSPVQSPRNTAKPNALPALDYAGAVGGDGGRAAHQEIRKNEEKRGPETLAKNGFPSSDSLLPGLSPTSAQTLGKVPPTGLDGKVCEQAPKGNEVPTLKPGVVDNGCTYTDDSKLKERFDEAAKHVAKVNYKDEDGKEHHGSALIVGKGSGVCYALTDQHVARKPNGDAHSDMTVRMPNGQIYPAESRVDKPTQDLNLVAVKTGADTESACSPATVARDGRPKLKGGQFDKNDEDRLGVGYPRDSQSPYASPGKLNGAAPLIYFAQSFGKGEDLQRGVLRSGTNYTGGQSGGGVFNQAGEATGLIARGDHKDGIETPITRSEVDEMIRKARH